MKFYTADLCDKYFSEVQVLEPILKSYGGSKRFMGQIVTVKLKGHNKTLVELLKTEGLGRVAVVDVGANFTAVVGDNLMKFAFENGWAGIVINGYVRDTKNTKEIDVGLFALGTCPKKTMEADNGGVLHEDLSFGGICFKEGEYIYADRDGVITSKTLLEMA